MTTKHRLFSLCLACNLSAASFYKQPQLFSTCPDEKNSSRIVDRFGPVGIGIELHEPAFVMKVKDIKLGSLAAATRNLMPGQIIETINGQKPASPTTPIPTTTRSASFAAKTKPSFSWVQQTDDKTPVEIAVPCNTRMWLLE